MYTLAFDTATLISEIEKRPAIWKKCLNHSSSYIRQQQWREIVEIYCGTKTISASKRMKLELQLRQKWRNIRDCFVKAYRAKTQNAGYAANKKKHYVYYNNLVFLIDSEVCTSQEDDSKMIQKYNDNENVDIQEDNQNEDSQNGDIRNEDSQNEDDPDRHVQYEIAQNDSDQEYAWTLKSSNEIKCEYIENECTEPQSDADNSCTSWCPKRKKRTIGDNKNRNGEDTQDTAHTSWEPKRIKTNATIDVVRPNLLEEDGDRLFFLSLVKEFKKIPEHMKMQSKLNILKLIQDAQCSNRPY